MSIFDHLDIVYISCFFDPPRADAAKTFGIHAELYVSFGEFLKKMPEYVSFT